MKSVLQHILSTLQTFFSSFGFRLTRRGFIPVISRLYRAKVDDKAFALLSSELRETIQWSRVDFLADDGINRTDSGTIWKTIPGGHKWLDYFSIYDREFAHLRGKPCRILEIGVYRGASLKMWRQFFGPDSVIVGIDIDENCRQFDDPKNHVHVRIGSQTDVDFLQSVVSEFGLFDLVIDDGSHVSSHQIASFNALFINGLHANGIYFIEDLEGVYWGHTTGQLDQKISSIDFLKMLIDMQNQVFRNHSYNHFSVNTNTMINMCSIPKVVSLIDSIKFYRSIAVIQKASVKPPAVYHI